MPNIKDIRYWTRNGKDARVYVHTDDGREGCLYLDGNGWHKKGEREGKLTDAEWQTARELSNKAHSKGNGWKTIYENDMWQYDSEKLAHEQGKKQAQVKEYQAKNANKHIETCAYCHSQIEVGAGWGEYISEKNTDEEDFDMIYHGYAGWYYYHNDSSVCERNRDAAKQAKRDEQAKEQARKDEMSALIRKVEAQTGLTSQMDWSWDDFGFHVEDILAESEHFVARKYTSTRYPDLKNGEDKVTLGFVVKEK